MLLLVLVKNNGHTAVKL